MFTQSLTVERDSGKVVIKYTVDVFSNINAPHIRYSEEKFLVGIYEHITPDESGTQTFDSLQDIVYEIEDTYEDHHVKWAILIFSNDEGYHVIVFDDSPDFLRDSICCYNSTVTVDTNKQLESIDELFDIMEGIKSHQSNYLELDAITLEIFYKKINIVEYGETTEEGDVAEYNNGTLFVKKETRFLRTKRAI